MEKTTASFSTTAKKETLNSNRAENTLDAHILLFSSIHNTKTNHQEHEQNNNNLSLNKFGILLLARDKQKISEIYAQGILTLDLVDSMNQSQAIRRR